jgi:2-iminobutanoate/2-iminopropanoate deaminase
LIKEKTLTKDFRILSTAAAGRSAFPTSQGAVVGNLVFTSGHGPLTPGGSRSEQVSFKDQVIRTMHNIEAVLKEAGTSLENCIKVEVILRRGEDFAEFNELYKTFFEPPYPPRMTFIAGLVRPDIDIEMSAIAIIPAKALKDR